MSLSESSQLNPASPVPNSELPTPTDDAVSQRVRGRGGRRRGPATGRGAASTGFRRRSDRLSGAGAVSVHTNSSEAPDVVMQDGTGVNDVDMGDETEPESDGNIPAALLEELFAGDPEGQAKVQAMQNGRDQPPDEPDKALRDAATAPASPRHGGGAESEAQIASSYSRATAVVNLGQLGEPTASNAPSVAPLTGREGQLQELFRHRQLDLRRRLDYPETHYFLQVDAEVDVPRPEGEAPPIASAAGAPNEHRDEQGPPVRRDTPTAVSALRGSIPQSQPAPPSAEYQCQVVHPFSFEGFAPTSRNRDEQGPPVLRDTPAAASASHTQLLRTSVPQSLPVPPSSEYQHAAVLPYQPSLSFEGFAPTSRTRAFMTPAQENIRARLVGNPNYLSTAEALVRMDEQQWNKSYKQYIYYRALLMMCEELGAQFQFGLGGIWPIVRWLQEYSDEHSKAPRSKRETVLSCEIGTVQNWRTTYSRIESSLQKLRVEFDGKLRTEIPNDQKTLFDLKATLTVWYDLDWAQVVLNQAKMTPAEQVQVVGLSLSRTKLRKLLDELDGMCKM